MTEIARPRAARPAPALFVEPDEPPASVHPRNRLNDLTGRDWVQATKSWFVCDGRAADFTADITRHPASFPPEMLMRFLRFFTKAGMTVLDPFAGCGSTLEAAWRTGRRGIGIELNAEYHKSCVRRIETLALESQRGSGRRTDLPLIHLADARNAAKLNLPPIDFVVTSPPYWNMLRRSRGNVKSAQKQRAQAGLDTHYGDDPRDLGNIDDYEAYLADLCELFAALLPLMSPSAYLVAVMQNIRTPEGVMRPAAWDFASRFSAHCILRQEFVWCQDRKFLGCWGYPSTYVSNVHHHYCLVFQKRS